MNRSNASGRWGRSGRRAPVRAVAVAVALLLGAPGWAAADPDPSTPVPAPTLPAPDAVALRAELAAASQQFAEAQRRQGDAAARTAVIQREVAAQQAAADAAKREIARYARWAYISSRDAEVGGILSRLAAGDMNSLAEAQVLLSTVGNVRARQLRDAVAVIANLDRLRVEAETVERDARAAMSAAELRGQELQVRLAELAALLGPEPALPTMTPDTCPKRAPPGTLTDGSDAIGVLALCQASVRQARSPAAARAIKWAFNHLGARYVADSVPVDDETFDGFHCANLVARSYYWGARFSAFIALPWTPAYAAPPPFLQPTQGRPRAGDINLMWRVGSTIAASAGPAGHAQLFIADGWVIQSGGTAGIVNVARYPNPWSGWNEVQFQVNA